MALQKYIPTPERMWELFTAYAKTIKAKPVKVKDWVGKDGEQVYREKERPLTLEGFENYCADEGIINDLGDYFSNKNEKYTEFSTICSRIRRVIRQDQIEGGMVGIYNPSITQRLQGLVERSASDDKSEVTIKVSYERKNGKHSPERAASGAGTDTE